MTVKIINFRVKELYQLKILQLLTINMGIKHYIFNGHQRTQKIATKRHKNMATERYKVNAKASSRRQKIKSTSKSGSLYLIHNNRH